MTIRSAVSALSKVMLMAIFFDYSALASSGSSEKQCCYGTDEEYCCMSNNGKSKWYNNTCNSKNLNSSNQCTVTCDSGPCSS